MRNYSKSNKKSRWLSGQTTIENKESGIIFEKDASDKDRPERKRLASLSTTNTRQFNIKPDMMRQSLQSRRRRVTVAAVVSKTTITAATDKRISLKRKPRRMHLEQQLQNAPTMMTAPASLVHKVPQTILLPATPLQKMQQ